MGSLMLMGNMGLYRNGATFGQQFIGVLDQLSTPSAAAYSLRKLRAAYNSPAIRVRRSSDSTEDNIGFTATGELNTAALLAFVGVGNNGFVTTWYDQSGNGRNATKSAAEIQPQIVSNGVLITENGRAYIDFTGNKGLGSNHNALLAFTAAVLKSDTSVFSQYHAIFDGAAGRRGGILEMNKTEFHVSVFPTAVSKNGTALAQPFDLAPITTPFQVSIQNSGVGNVLNGRIGNFDNLPIGGAAKQSETIVFSAVLSTTNRQTLERNQGAYYSITVT